MSSKLKSPPPFNPEEDTYEAWKQELEMWEVYTELDLKKRGAAVFLSLKGKAKEAVRDMKAATLNVDAGLDMVKKKLDEVFLKDVNTRAFIAFQKFYQYRRASGDNYETFIVQFEQLYHKLTEIPNMQFPDGVQAFFLLMAANLPNDLEKVVRATTGEITYKEMRDQIKKVCGSLDGGESHEEEPLPVKDEVLFASWGRGRGRGRSRGRSFSRNDRNFSRNGRSFSVNDRDVADNNRSESNDRGATGNRGASNSSNTKCCHLCNSPDHLVYQCPHRGSFAETMEAQQRSSKSSSDSSKTHQVHIVLFSARKGRNLLSESLGKGVLDSACTKTLSGEVWMNEYLSTLQPSDRKLVTERASETLFRFGDGEECKSLKQLTIPVNIGGQLRRMMTVEIVPTEVPLLISNKTMKKMGMNGTSPKC